MEEQEKTLDSQLFENVVSQACDMNEAAFAKIYNSCVTPIFRFFYARVNNKNLAEDLTQVVFLKAWENIKSVQDIDSVLAWLYTVSRNVLIDYWRKKKEISVDDQSYLEDKGEKTDIDEELDKDESLKDIFSILNQLSAEQKEIIMLRFFEEASSKEIQKIMKKSSTAIRSLQYRALTNLKKILKNNGDGQ